MKRHLGFIFFILLVFAACQKAPAPKTITNSPIEPKADSILKPEPVTLDGKPVQAALDSILHHARQGDCEGMAPWLVFKSGNTAETWKRSLRYNDDEEQLAIEKECAKLQVLVTGLQDYSYVEFASTQDAEGEWLIWKVKLNYQDGENEASTFAFLKVGDRYLLGDIE
jgi:hypothetical protein